MIYLTFLSVLGLKVDIASLICWAMFFLLRTTHCEALPVGIHRRVVFRSKEEQFLLTWLRMEELIQECQQAGQHFPLDSMWRGTFKSAKHDGLDEIVTVTSITIHNWTLGRGTHIPLQLFGDEFSKNSPCCICARLRSNQLMFGHSMRRTAIPCIQWC